MTLRILGTLACTTLVAPALAAQQPPARGYMADASLAFLEPMIGTWAPQALPDSVDPMDVGHRYAWVVGRRAIRVHEGLRRGPDGTPALEGMIYWNPATELVEFVAVAGHGEGEGRLFVGEYRALEDGAIERTYDVFYRTMEDIPGDAFGGTRRRYREVYRFTGPDRIASTLEWFHDGAWRGFGQFAKGGYERVPPAPTPEAAPSALSRLQTYVGEWRAGTVSRRRCGGDSRAGIESRVGSTTTASARAAGWRAVT